MNYIVIKNELVNYPVGAILKPYKYGDIEVYKKEEKYPYGLTEDFIKLCPFWIEELKDK